MNWAIPMAVSLKKRMIHSYCSPVLRSFRDADYCSSFAQHLRSLIHQAPKNVVIKRDRRRHAPWVWVQSAQKIPRPKVQAWAPKLYLTVSKSNYLPVLERLLKLSATHPLSWKFCGRTDNLHRPDKIVFHFSEIEDLKKALPYLRATLLGAQFHTLSHAALTSEVGLERSSSRGIHVGADPTFLPNMSWRLYRSLALASIQQNEAYWKEKPGGVPSALKLFNLSDRHDGPAKFKMSAREISKIKKLWSEMF